MKVTLLSFSEINKKWFLQALSERKDNTCLCHLLVSMWINSCLHEQSYCTDKIIIPKQVNQIVSGLCFLCRLVQMSSIRHQIRRSGVGLANPEPESS